MSQIPALLSDPEDQFPSEKKIIFYIKFGIKTIAFSVVKLITNNPICAWDQSQQAAQ